MKRLACWVLLLSLLTTATLVAEAEVTTYTLGEFEYDLPSSWITEEKESNRYHFAYQLGSDIDGYIVTTLLEIGTKGSMSYDYLHKTYKEIANGAARGAGKGEPSEERKIKIDNKPGYFYDFIVDVEGREMPLTALLLYANGVFFSLTYANRNFDTDQRHEHVLELAATIKHRPGGEETSTEVSPTEEPLMEHPIPEEVTNAMIKYFDMLEKNDVIIPFKDYEYVTWESGQYGFSYKPTPGLQVLITYNDNGLRYQSARIDVDDSYAYDKVTEILIGLLYSFADYSTKEATNVVSFLIKTVEDAGDFKATSMLAKEDYTIEFEIQKIYKEVWLTLNYQPLP